MEEGTVRKFKLQADDGKHKATVRVELVSVVVEGEDPDDQVKGLARGIASALECDTPFASFGIENIKFTNLSKSDAE